MPSVSSNWEKESSGFERRDEVAVGVYVTPADVHYHGDDVHARPGVPSAEANAYQVFAVTDLGGDESRIPLIHYADVNDAVAFAALVTRYVDARDSPVAIEEIGEQEPGYEDDWWPEGVVDADDHPPREALSAMLGTYAEVLAEALSS
ncbi:hypothetical protein ACFO0N_09505 [Halobium salinum]|uniref:Uncharacterized protein n=1 Tax=Halobium salinum TaxID=1364940 RepID=A0ABD5PBU0_9EURY|nr:hypothetical protein [Halobium salinum]